MPFRALKSVLVWSAALGGGALLLTAAIIDVHEAISAHIADRTPVTTVDYFSGSIHYAVPVKYHPEITRYSEKRNYSALGMMLFLPDFSSGAEHLEELNQPGWRNQVTLLFEHGLHLVTVEEQIAILTNKLKGVHTPPEPVGNGCNLYRTPLMLPGDVYVCMEDGQKIVVSCGRKSDVPSPSCTVFENISSDLTVIYHYSANYAADAVSIDQRIRALVASWVMPGVASTQ